MVHLQKDFDLFSNFIHGHMPYMKFLFVRPDATEDYHRKR